MGNLGNQISLQLEGCGKELALFDMAIDSKLHGCDLASLKSMLAFRYAAPLSGFFLRYALSTYSDEHAVLTEAVAAIVTISSRSSSVYAQE